MEHEAPRTRRMTRRRRPHGLSSIQWWLVDSAVDETDSWSTTPVFSEGDELGEPVESHVARRSLEDETEPERVKPWALTSGTPSGVAEAESDSGSDTDVETGPQVAASAASGLETAQHEAEPLEETPQPPPAVDVPQPARPGWYRIIE